MLRTPAPCFWRRLLGTTTISLASITSGSLAWALQSPPTPVTRADSLVQAPVTSLTDLLQNRVPGLTIQHSSDTIVSHPDSTVKTPVKVKNLTDLLQN